MDPKERKYHRKKNSFIQRHSSTCKIISMCVIHRKINKFINYLQGERFKDKSILD